MTVSTPQRRRLENSSSPSSESLASSSRSFERLLLIRRSLASISRSSALEQHRGSVTSEGDLTMNILLGLDVFFASTLIASVFHLFM